MKIAYLFDGDNAVFGTPWIGYFAKKGHETYWISLSEINDEVPEGVKTFSLAKYLGASKDGKYPKDPLSILKAAKRVRQILREVSPDVLHVHSVGTYGLVAALTRFQPLIATAWGSEVLITGKQFVKRPLVKYALKRSKLITCDAEHMRTAMMNMGASKEKIHIINFGTDMDRFRPKSRNMPLREKLGINDRPVVTSFRSLRPLYDIGTFVRAIPDVLKRVPETMFVIAGGGEERDNLMNLAASLGVSKNVMFTGFLSYEVIPEYQAMGDVYVSTSLSDAGIAASTSEAMASGVPVVVSDTAENSLWVKDGEGGFLFPAKDSDMLAKKLICLLEGKEKRERFGAYGRSVIDERNNYDREMGKMEKLYERVIENYGNN